MTKRRSWHFYLILISLTTLLAIHLIWSYTPVKDEVKTIIVNKLQPYLGESFLISDFGLGFKHITFYKLSAADQRGSFSIELDEIKIGYEPFKLLTNNFNFVKDVRSVTIIRPRIHLYQPGEEDQKERDLSLEKVLEEIVINFKKFPAIDYVSIVDGEILVQMQGNRQVPLFTKLNGKINYLPDDQRINLDLSGTCLGEVTSSLAIDGIVDFENKNFQAKVELDECTYSSQLPFWSHKAFQLQGAQLNGNIQIANSSFSIDSLRFSGPLLVKNLSAYTFNQHITADSLNLNLNERDLEIEPFNCKVEDADAVFGGKINNLLDPTVDWQLNFKNYSAKYLQKSHDIFEPAYEGKIAGEIEFSGPFNEIEIFAQATCPDLLFAVIPFNTVKAKLHYQNALKQLDLNYIRADFLQFRTQGAGIVNFNQDDINLRLNSDIPVPRGYFSFLNGLNEGGIYLDTDFSGNFKTKKYGGNFTFSVESKDTLLTFGGGPFSLDDQFFQFAVNSANLEDTLQVRGGIEKLFSDPTFNILDVKNFPVNEFTKNPLLAHWITDRRVNFYFAGPYNSLRAKMKISSQNSFKEFVMVSANIRDIFMDNQRFWGDFTLNTAPEKIEGDFEVSFTDKGSKTEIDAPELFSGELFVGSTPQAPFQGTLQLQKVSVTDFVTNSPALSALFEQGFLEGQMQFGGTVKNPQVYFDLDANDFIVNEVGYYNTRLSGKLNNYALTFDNFWVNLNGNQVFNADLYWNLLDDSLNIALQAKDIESNFLAETIFKDRDIIQGKFTYAIDVSGPAKRPAIQGEVQINDGYFGGNSFDDISLVFEDSLAEETSFWDLSNHIAKIHKFIYESQDEYTIHGFGILSVDQDGPIDINIEVDGNVLSELPELEPFFRNPQSNGHLSMNIQGSRSNPYFEEFYLNITDGSLEFDGIIPPISNLQAEIELTNASDYVRIKSIEGLVNNRWARIYNQRADSLHNPRLKPWLFKEIGLNFGVLIWETDEQGIPLSIPGLMEEGDWGYFATRGRTADEKFYFAGPPELPIAYGDLQLYDCRVTFPFVGMYDDEGEMAYDEESQVLDFLMNMEWDVKAEPGNNIRYFVNVPAYVGEVYMDLNIDNSSPGLKFTGRLIDDSFRIEGSAESTQGKVEYLDTNFKVERFGVEFNRFEIYPEVYGRAYTTVRDSAGDFPKDIYLELYVIDPVTKKEVSKGRWEDFRFKLVPGYEPVVGETQSQEELLAHLGYSVQNIQYKAGEVGLSMTEDLLIRPLFRPLERQLEQRLNLDYVRLRSKFTTNLFYLSFQNRVNLFSNSASSNFYTNNNLDPALLLLQSSEVTFGKYLLRDIYLTYTGQLVPGFEESKLGINHTFELEYRLLYNLLIELEYSKFQFNPFYSDDINQDFRIRLRHSFNF